VILSLSLSLLQEVLSCKNGTRGKVIMPYVLSINLNCSIDPASCQRNATKRTAQTGEDGGLHWGTDLQPLLQNRDTQ